jgi:hypothetical protein
MTYFGENLKSSSGRQRTINHFWKKIKIGHFLTIWHLSKDEICVANFMFPW